MNTAEKLEKTQALANRLFMRAERGDHVARSDVDMLVANLVELASDEPAIDRMARRLESMDGRLSAAIEDVERLKTLYIADGPGPSAAEQIQNLDDAIGENARRLERLESQLHELTNVVQAQRLEWDAARKNADATAQLLARIEEVDADVQRMRNDLFGGDLERVGLTVQKLSNRTVRHDNAIADVQRRVGALEQYADVLAARINALERCIEDTEAALPVDERIDRIFDRVQRRLERIADRLDELANE